MQDESGITHTVVINHMQAMEQRLTKRIDQIGDNLTADMDKLRHNLTFQIDAINKRLDDVEIEYLPKRVSRIEKHLALPPIKH